jgi:hypothetical protein
LECAIETEVNITFHAAMITAAYVFAASITRSRQISHMRCLEVICFKGNVETNKRQSGGLN